VPEGIIGWNATTVLKHIHTETEEPSKALEGGYWGDG
jgi:hypothetical protein